MSWGKPKDCSECRAPIFQPRLGRARLTCTTACYEARRARLKRFKRHSVAENLSASEKAYLEEFRREMISPLGAP